MFRDRNQTITKAISFLCAPDTIDPPRPRGAVPAGRPSERAQAASSRDAQFIPRTGRSRAHFTLIVPGSFQLEARGRLLKPLSPGGGFGIDPLRDSLR